MKALGRFADMDMGDQAPGWDLKPIPNRSLELEDDDEGLPPLRWAFPERPQGLEELPSWKLLQIAKSGNGKAGSAARAELAYRILVSPEFRDALDRLENLCARAGLDTSAAFAAEAIWVALRRAQSAAGLPKYAARVLRTLVGEDLWCGASARPRKSEVPLEEADRIPSTETDPGDGPFWPPLWDVIGQEGRAAVVHMAIEAMRAGAYGDVGVRAAGIAERALTLGGDLERAMASFSLDGEEAVSLLNTLEQAVLDSLDVLRDEIPSMRLEDLIYEEVLQVLDAIERLGDATRAHVQVQ